jgi:hypothetical protein
MAVASTGTLIIWVPEALSLGIKRPNRKADRSFRSSAKAKNARSCISTFHTSSWRDAWLNTEAVLNLPFKSVDRKKSWKA